MRAEHNAASLELAYANHEPVTIAYLRLGVALIVAGVGHLKTEA